MKQSHHYSKIKKSLFANLPSEIIIGILSTLPIRSIIRCKCVCKSWLALLQTPEFVNSHLLNAKPGLAIIHSTPKLFTFFEFEDGPNLQHHGLHYNLAAHFNLPCCKDEWEWICSSANGLLFMSCKMGKGLTFCICNPITREYIHLDCTNGVQDDTCNKLHTVVLYGFGASKITGQHKVVIVYQDLDKSGCHIYTLETELWRRRSHVGYYDHHSIGTLLNGNLHFLGLDLKNSRLQISCIDLETELYSLFPSPLARNTTILAGLSALGDCLCLCDSNSVGGFSLWLMKEYGVEKSWTRHFFVCNNYNSFDPCYFSMCPIKHFEDGDILVLWGHIRLSYYSKKNNTIEEFNTFNPPTLFNAVIHTPNFCSLKSLGIKNVRSF